MGSLPVAEDAVLLVSELLSTNAVLHTTSGDGGAFEVAVHVSAACARIEVRDQGSEDHPTAEPADTLAEAGRGISLVELISTRWGHTANDNGRSVFFELSWEDAD